MSPARRARRRNSVLAALEQLRQLDPGLSLSDAVAFLYICENEGVNVRELAQLTATKNSKASRTARRLAERDCPHALWPSIGVVELRGNAHDGRSKTLHLTLAGIQVRNSIEDLIADATPIQAQRAPTRPA
jgi:DNA-binding MarR family transcriptional regulator